MGLKSKILLPKFVYIVRTGQGLCYKFLPGDAISLLACV